MRLLPRVCLVALIVSTMLLLTFLFVKTQAIDPQEHYKFHRIVGRIHELHAMLNQDMLKARHGYLRHYDPLTSELSELRRLYRELQNIPTFMDEAGKADVSKRLKQSRDLLAQQEV